MEQKSKSGVLSLLVLHIGVLVYSASAVFIKAASGFSAFSPRFFLFYGLSLLALLIYALMWQQALRRFSLGTAYVNRAASAVWSLVFGRLIFSETVTLKHIAGIVIIIAGVILVVSGDE